jgi:hypothetical protein
MTKTLIALIALIGCSSLDEGGGLDVERLDCASVIGAGCARDDRL